MLLFLNPMCLLHSVQRAATVALAQEGIALI